MKRTLIASALLAATDLTAHAATPAADTTVVSAGVAAWALRRVEASSAEAMIERFMVVPFSVVVCD